LSTSFNQGLGKVSKYCHLPRRKIHHCNEWAVDLKNCHIYHENMLDKTLADCVCENQMVLNGNIDIYENTECIKEWIEKIKEIVK
jgi:hypothetical protein